MPEKKKETGKKTEEKVEKVAVKEEYTKEEIEEGKIPALLGYIFFLCVVPLFGFKDNRFAQKHGKQGLALFIVEVIALLFLVPTVSKIFWWIIILAAIVVAVIGMVHSLQGKWWRIPLIGDLLDKYGL